MFERQKYGCWSMEIQTIENATNHSLSNEWPRWQLCGGIASACRGRYCQADGQADPQQVPQRPGLPFINLLRYLWTCLVLDFLLVQIVIGPFTVAIWRGAWELYDDIFLVRLLYNLYNIEMDFSSELAWRGPHVCWPCLLHMWLRGQFCDCEVFKVFAKLHILR